MSRRIRERAQVDTLVGLLLLQRRVGHLPIGIPGGKIEPRSPVEETCRHHHLTLPDVAAALEIAELKVVRVP